MKIKICLVVFLSVVCLNALQAQKRSIDTLSILSFNDFHGAFAPDDGVPGAAKLVQAILNEKQKYRDPIVVSVGDNFSGSYFSRITRGEPLSKMFKTMGVAMSAVGNHEFDWGLKYLIDTAAVYSNYISANITTDGVNIPTWTKPYHIINYKLKDGDIFKIAFIGLTTTETAHKTTPENIEGLEFIHPLAGASVETLYDLKKEGKIDMIVLLMHIGTDMEDKDRIIEPNAAVLPYMDKIDAIISGHSHKLVLDKVNNCPIIQAGVNGTHIGKLSFAITQDKKGNGYVVRYIAGDTLSTQNAAENRDILAHVNRYIDKYGLNEHITVAKTSIIHDRNINKFNYTSVGAYVSSSFADCYMKNAKWDNTIPVIGMCHYGGVRASVAAGEVTRLRAGNVLPFGGMVVAYHFTGERLKSLLQAGRENKNGYLQTSNMSLQLDAQNKISKIFYKHSDGSLSEIKENDNCVVALYNFITNGGDGYDASLFSGYEIKEFNDKCFDTTTSFINYLKTQDLISEETAPRPIVFR